MAHGTLKLVSLHPSCQGFDTHPHLVNKNWTILPSILLEVSNNVSS
jgi:hypothetical protein